jgi:3-oxoadipate enol-lactonase/4-carboxymuconolactone decarboxylase
MPQLRANGVDLHYDLSGPESAPVVAFSNSLGATLEMWDAQVAALRGRFRCLRYDTRGHGRSSTLDLPARINDLADDLAALLEGLGIKRVHLVGLSLGGMTGQAFAVRHPERLKSLSLMATTAFMPPRQAWLDRAELVHQEGMQAIANVTMERWFTPAFAADARLASLRERFLAVDPAGYAVCCSAIAEMDLRPGLASIQSPTLVIAGADDPATPPAMAEELCRSIAGAELVVLPRARHMLAVECHAVVNAYLTAFLDRYRERPELAIPASFGVGLANRKVVLGADHVERSLAGAGPFAMPWQDFITRIAWGEIWGDPALPWKTRSLVTLSLMVALGREEEFRLHLRPALRNGVTIDELRSLLTQCAVYAGVPAANAAFRWTREELGAELANASQEP